jgi:uncharacterized protein YndB with AHSA1/START domain
VSRIEKVFTVRVPVARAWQAFADGEERSQWEAELYEIDPRPGGRVHWVLPGIETTGEVTKVEPERVLQHTERNGPHSGAEITVTFESLDDGTHVTVVHAGFGDEADLDEWLEGTSLGWAQAISDLIVYLETGVPARRFTTRMQSPGMRMHDTPAGVVVTEVEPAGMASEAGLQPGDLVLRVGDVPVFAIADLWVLMRQSPAGTKLEVEYVRGGERHHGTGVIGPWT